MWLELNSEQSTSTTLMYIGHSLVWKVVVGFPFHCKPSLSFLFLVNLIAMQSPVTTAATTKISVETAADAEDERMAVEFEGPPRYGEKVRVWRWKFYQAQPMPLLKLELGY